MARLEDLKPGASVIPDAPASSCLDRESSETTQAQTAGVAVFMLKNVSMSSSQSGERGILYSRTEPARMRHA
jgi:hypothetical protein